MAWQLGQAAVQGLLTRVGVPFETVDGVVMGCVAADIATTNVAREITLGTGLPRSVPAYTCTVACISANQAVTNGACAILAGKAETVIAGGVETFSDVNIRISEKYRRFLLDITLFNRPKTWKDWIPHLKKMRPLDFIAPQKPSISEFSTGLIMGENADRLVKRLGVSRERQDAYAVTSHQRAVTAAENAFFDEEIIPVVVDGNTVDSDNGPRADANQAKLSTLKHAFDKKYGTVTAGNSSFLSDGGAAVMLMSEAKARELGLNPIGYLSHYAYSAQDPVEELLLGPAFSMARLFQETGLTLDEIGVFEIHEAFAGQVLANLDCMASDDYCRDRLGLSGAMGEMDMDKLNRHGGSLSIGHPFGATGARLITTCCRRLKQEGHRYGVVAGCAAGAVGSAILIESAE